MGAILHAYNGNIEIEEEVTIGAGVLVVGRAKIAAKACIGALSTVIAWDLEAQQTVAAGSILGDTSRQVSEPSASVSTNRQDAYSTTETTPAEPTTPSASVSNNRQDVYSTTETSSSGTTAPSASVSNNRQDAYSTTETSCSGTAATPTNEEEAERALAEQSHYVSPGNRYNTVIQPQPVSIPQTPTPTNIEEEQEATAPSNAEANNGQDAGSTEQSQFVSPGPGYHTFIQAKPISIPEITVKRQDAYSTVNNDVLTPEVEAEPPEPEEEEKSPTPKNPVAGLDYVQGMMKTLFPHKNISLAREDEED
jgi:carbonic anhydrase/acetyltransferase-like protein (isoleucine patch superfamily)